MGPRRFKEKETEGPPQADRMIRVGISENGSHGKDHDGTTSDENLAKKERILKTREYQKVYKLGVFCKRNSIVMYCLPNDLEKNRLGFSISSRNIKLAHKRNRIRRHLKEIYRKNKDSFKQGFDIVFVVRRAASRLTPQKNLKDIFFGLARESGILK